MAKNYARCQAPALGSKTALSNRLPAKSDTRRSIASHYRQNLGFCLVRTDSMNAYRFATMKVFSHEVKHEKVISFRHGNNVIENFFRCKRRFPRFRTIESARRYIGHWVSEYNAEKLKISEMFIILLVNVIQRCKSLSIFILPCIILFLVSWLCPKKK